MESTPDQIPKDQTTPQKPKWFHTSKVIAVISLMFLYSVSAYIIVGVGISFWDSQWSGDNPGRLDKDHLEFLSNSLTQFVSFVGIMTGLVLRFYLVRKRDRGDGQSSSNVFESIATIIKR